MTAPSASEMMAYLARTSAAPVSVTKRITKPGSYKIRILPGTNGSYEFRRKWSKHYIPRTDGLPGKHVFVCDKFTNDTRCNICEGYWSFVNDKKAKEASGRHVDPVLDRVISDARASVRYLVNAVVYGENDDKPVVLEVTKTTMDTIEMYLSTRNHLLWDLESGQALNFVFRPRTTGSGLQATVIDLDPVSPVPLGVSDLHNLDEVLKNEVLRGSHPASSFSGDFLNPVRAGAARPALVAPSTAMGYVAPGLTTAVESPPWGDDSATPAVSPGLANAPGNISREELNAAVRAARENPVPATAGGGLSEVDKLLAEMNKLTGTGSAI